MACLPWQPARPRCRHAIAQHSQSAALLEAGGAPSATGTACHGHGETSCADGDDAVRSTGGSSTGNDVGRKPCPSASGCGGCAIGWATWCDVASESGTWSTTIRLRCWTSSWRCASSWSRWRRRMKRRTTTSGCGWCVDGESVNGSSCAPAPGGLSPPTAWRTCPARPRSPRTAGRCRPLEGGRARVEMGGGRR